MTSRDDVSRAMAFFESTDDVVLLHQLAAEVAPKARKLVGQYLTTGTEETIPPPADLRAARQAATAEHAVQTLRGTTDFALLQAIARSIGRRIEAIEIVASAEFPEGARVIVPVSIAFPPRGPFATGTVEGTGTALRILLDNGETWEGSPSLARLESIP